MAAAPDDYLIAAAVVLDHLAGEPWVPELARQANRLRGMHLSFLITCRPEAVASVRVCSTGLSAWVTVEFVGAGHSPVRLAVGALDRAARVRVAGMLGRPELIDNPWGIPDRPAPHGDSPAVPKAPPECY